MRTLTLSVILTATLLLVAASAPAGEFYQWTDRAGVVSVTDDVKHIPKAYQAIAVKRNTEDIGRDAAITPMTISGAEYAAAVNAALERYRAVNASPVVNPNRLNDCTGHVVVTSKRIQVGEYNRRVYIVTDECGRVRTVTPFSPDVQINR